MATPMGILAQLVGEDGSLVGSLIEVSPGGGNAKVVPAVGFGGGTYLVGWWRNNGGMWERRIEVAPVATDGTVGATSEVHLDDQNQIGSDLDIESDGTDFFVVGHRTAFCWVPDGPAGTIGRVVGADGVPISDTVLISTEGGGSSCTSETKVTVTLGATDYLVTTSPNIYMAADGVFGQLVDTTGALVGTTADTNFDVSSASGTQTLPDAARLDGEHVVVFKDTRWPFPAIYAQRLDDAGMLVGRTASANEPIFATPDEPGAPRIAASATGGVIVFTLNSDIHATTIAPRSM
jgi:hypothetical protein